MAQTKNCPKCGTISLADAAICDTCGEDISDTPVTGNAAAPQPMDECQPPNVMTEDPISFVHVPTPADASAEKPPESSSTCSCADPILRNENGAWKCLACGRQVTQTVDSTVTAEGALDSSAAPTIPPEMNSAEIEIKFPWGVSHRFRDRVVIGRARHPDCGVGSLPEAIRKCLQQDYPDVSRYHAIIWVVDHNTIGIRSLRALNGLMAGDERIQAGVDRTQSLPCDMSLGSRCRIHISVLEKSD